MDGCESDGSGDGEVAEGSEGVTGGLTTPSPSAARGEWTQSLNPLRAFLHPLPPIRSADLDSLAGRPRGRRKRERKEGGKRVIPVYGGRCGGWWLLRVIIVGRRWEEAARRLDGELRFNLKISENFSSLFKI